MNRLLSISIGILVAISIVFTGCGGGGTVTRPSSSSEPLSLSEITAIKDYTNTIIGKLDLLYGKFEEGESNAKRIADERIAPYNMAIGSMAEVRKIADEIQALTVPPGAEGIYETTIAKLRDLKNGLDEIALKEPSEVSLTDPNNFYIAYLDVLIEIPKLKQDITALAEL